MQKQNQNSIQCLISKIHSFILIKIEQCQGSQLKVAKGTTKQLSDALFLVEMVRILDHHGYMLQSSEKKIKRIEI